MTAAIVVAAVGGVLGALLLRGAEAAPSSDESVPDSRSISPMLAAQMDEASAAGPSAIRCTSALEGRLKCAAAPDHEVLTRLRRGEAVYGRTVIGFPNGVHLTRDAVPRFERTDITCEKPRNGAMACWPVTVVQPTVRAGAPAFAFYKRHRVTFGDSMVISHMGRATVPLRVLE